MEYQEEAARFFRSLGMSARVEEPVTGLRSGHNIDVWVCGSLYGIEFRWVVECKAWKTNVSKEKVLALASVVEDVGADRGFLLSEIGFQSGAILQATKRNITLTSIRELGEVVNYDAFEKALSSLMFRAGSARAKLWDRHYRGGRYLVEHLISDHWYYLDFLISQVFAEASKQAFPIVYWFNSSLDPAERVAETVEELLHGLQEIVQNAEDFLEREMKSSPTVSSSNR